MIKMTARSVRQPGKLLFTAPKNAVIARSAATWQSPGSSGIYEKWTNALTNLPELLGDCHDQSADWSRNDSVNSLNTALAHNVILPKITPFGGANY